MPSILNNVAALQASRQLGITANGMKTTIERLTTGRRINHASDDAAGLASATQFDANAREAAELRKTQNNTYYASAALDGYLDEATNLVQRLVELAAGNNASTAEFTAVSSLASAAAVQGGVTLTAAITDSTSAKAALDTLSTGRQGVAATMAAALSNANLYGIQVENFTAQKSNIMDADIGAEVVNLTKWQILSQAGNSALGQANQASQYVLALLR